MANADAAFGFRAVNQDGSACTNFQVHKYYVPSTDSTALYKGDPVIIAGSADAAGVPTVTRATAGSGAYVTGVVVDFDPVTGVSSPNLGRTYRPASTAMYVWVADDPDQLFEIQEDSDTSTLAAANVGQNADFIIGTGSTVTGMSATELDSSTANTTNTLQCRIERLAPREDNAIGAQANWIVRFNLHQKRYTTGV